jgi:hypothetical protein
MPSDRTDTFAQEAEANSAFASMTPGELRPHAADTGGVRVSGGRMGHSRFGGRGRPKDEEVKRRLQEFRSLVAAGVPIPKAAQDAGISDRRALEELTPIVQSLLQQAA